MSSLTLTLSGKSSSLEANYFPPIELDRESNYLCCLIDFQTYNSIPNVSDSNNKIYTKKLETIAFHDEGINASEALSTYEEYLRKDLDWTFESRKWLNDQLTSVGRMEANDLIRSTVELHYFTTTMHEIPSGSYEASDIITFLEENIAGMRVSLDRNTGKCSIRSDSLFIDFTKDNTIRNILGFNSKIIEPSDYAYVGDYPVNITDINAIRIDCNIVTGSYMNGKSSHNIHEFYPIVEPGYKIVEVPNNLIYLPVVGHVIQTLRVDITDQEGNLIDFRGETVTCRLHIKKDR